MDVTSRSVRHTCQSVDTRQRVITAHDSAVNVGDWPGGDT
jgi:hypothetical protein